MGASGGVAGTLEPPRVAKALFKLRKLILEGDVKAVDECVSAARRQANEKKDFIVLI
jgi:hypothetical protein